MNILFYTLAAKRSRDIESQAIEFSKKGNSIFLLTQSAHSVLHDNFSERGFFVEFRSNKKHSFFGWLLSELYHLSKFLRVHKINVVYSHLEPCNLIAVLCQFINPGVRFILYRHHAEALEFEASKRGRWLSKQVYTLAHQVIAVSANAKSYMVKQEKINPDKISVIPLAFNFGLYDLPFEYQVKGIRDKYTSDLLICTVGRLTSLKRIDAIIKVASLVKKHLIDVKLLILGDGEELNYLKGVAIKERVEDCVYFLGFVENVLPYMAASDVYIHLSQTEASCTAVKEAGLVSKPVIVCKGVGDFDEYIENDVNGWRVDENDCIFQSLEIFLAIYNKQYNSKLIGENLNRKILEHFNIANVIDRYDVFHK